jgi:hypothetical protein
MRRSDGRPRSGGARRRAPVLLAALVTTGWAAIVSYTSMLLAVALVTLASGGAPARAVVRFGTAAWLLGHGVPISAGQDRITLVPLALTLLAGWRVVRAGVHTSRAIGGRGSRSARPVLLAALSVALVYGLLGLAAAAFAGGAGLRVPVLRAGATLAVFGLLAAALGGLVETGTSDLLRAAMPEALRDGLRTGAVAALLVLGAGAGVAGVAVAVAGHEASAMLTTYRTGVAGQAGLTLLCLVYAPNLAVWSAAYLLGPGFAVGAGTAVSAARVSLGAIPAVPALAGLPSTAASGAGVLLLGLPPAAGMVAGVLLVRRRLRRADAARGGPGGGRLPGGGRASAGAGEAVGWWPLLGSAALSGPVAGVLLGLAALVSGGSIGSGRLVSTGPDAVLVGLLAVPVVTVGAVIAAAAARLAANGRAGG